MAKIKLKSKFKAGDLVEVIQDVMFIPQGVYIFERDYGSFLSLSLSSGESVGVGQMFKKYLRKVDRSALPRLVTSEQLMEHHRSNLVGETVESIPGIVSCEVREVNPSVAEFIKKHIESRGPVH